MNIGFTGAQVGITQRQGEVLLDYLATAERGEFHHGDCIGGDLSADIFANLAGGWKVIVHPPSNPKKRAYCTGDVMLPEKPYLVRNRDIVDACDMLIACPKSEHEELRSGTWSTIRYAKHVGKRITIIYPDGRTERINHPTESTP
jgi:hypothetical protein